MCLFLLYREPQHLYENWSKPKWQWRTAVENLEYMMTLCIKYHTSQLRQEEQTHDPQLKRSASTQPSFLWDQEKTNCKQIESTQKKVLRDNINHKHFATIQGDSHILAQNAEPITSMFTPALGTFAVHLFPACLTRQHAPCLLTAYGFTTTTQSTHNLWNQWLKMLLSFELVI